MTFATMPFLEALETAASQAEAAEKQCRREAAQRIAALERERVFAFRRLNLIRAIAGAVAGAESEEVAVANALAVLRDKLGWVSDSEARMELLTRFAPVSQALFRISVRSEEPAVPSAQEALAGFEAWYAESRRTPFWILFETYVQETPNVGL